MYKTKPLFVLRSVQNTQREASTMYNFLMLNLVVRKKTLGFKKLKLLVYAISVMWTEISFMPCPTLI